MVLKTLRMINKEVTDLQYKMQIPREKLVITISKDLELEIRSMSELLNYSNKKDKNIEPTLLGCHVVVDEYAKYSYYSIGLIREV